MKVSWVWSRFTKMCGPLSKKINYEIYMTILILQRWFFFSRAPSEVIILWQDVIVHAPGEVIKWFRIFYVLMPRKLVLKIAPSLFTPRMKEVVSLCFQVCLGVRGNTLAEICTKGLIKAISVGHFLLMSWNFHFIMIKEWKYVWVYLAQGMAFLILIFPLS